MNKTATTLMIEWLRKYQGENENHIIQSFSLLVEAKAIELRDTVERDQIINAYVIKFSNIRNRDAAENYYNETYQNK